MPSSQQKLDWLLREKYNGKKTAAFRRDVKRLRAGEHIDYVIGFADFLGLKIDLSARPLIPRPETEYWTERTTKIIKSEIPRRAPNFAKATLDTRNDMKVLDVFCGSGAIGLAFLKHLPNARVDFADIEAAYFAGIRKSAKWNNISHARFRCIRSDILKNIGAKKYDYILANPPYIPKTGRRVQKSVLIQEPHAALFGGKDGMRFIRALLRAAPQHLLRGGTLVMEFDPPQKTRIGAMARRLGYVSEFSKDQYGRWRYVSLKMKVQGTRSRSLA
jgi:release factor glutamine methyltransferase